MQVELFQPSGVDPDNRWANSARLLNWYRQQGVLKSVPGMESLLSLSGAFARSAITVGNVPHVVFGGALWRIARNGNFTRLGGLNNSSRTSMCGNNGSVCVAAGGSYYVWDETGFYAPPTGAFSDIGSVCFFNQSTIITELSGRRVQWSNPADPRTLPGTFATTESRDDNNVRCVTAGNSLLIMKERSIEQWTQVGTGFQRIPGGTTEIGLKGYSLVTDIPDGVFFIGSNNIAYISAGEGLAPVSNVAVNTSIAKEEPERVLYYEDEGNAFACIIFRDRPAWCFDIATREWHERADGEAWSARVAYGAFDAFHVVDDFGMISRLGGGTDGGDPLIRQATSITLDFGLNRRRISEILLSGRVGMSLDSLDGDAPMIIAEVSHDHGLTWGEPFFRSTGDAGATNRQIRMRSMGQFEQFTLRLSYSNDDDFTLGVVGEVNVR